MKIHLVIAVVICAALSGCSELRGPLRPDRATSLGVQTTYVYAKNTKEQSEQEDKSKREFYLHAYETAKSDAPAQRLVRDRIISELMGLIDDEFNQFSYDLRADKNYKNIWTKIISIGLTGAAPFSGATQAKALAGIDTGIKGMSESIDQYAWNSMAPEMLINTMKANRAAIAAQIIVTIKNKGVDEYPIEAALRDLVAYRNEGFVTSALASLAKQAATQADNNEKVTQRIKPLSADKAEAELKNIK